MKDCVVYSGENDAINATRVDKLTLKITKLSRPNEFPLNIIKCGRSTQNNTINKNTLKNNNMLNLMYITKRPEIAQIAEEAGVDWIFIDMEFIGKNSRQGGLDTVQNHHTVEDVANVKAAVQKAKILVREPYP